MTDQTPPTVRPGQVWADNDPRAAGRIVEEARLEAAALLHMERQHGGHGRDGHLNEDDLLPLLTALQIDPEVKP